MSSDTPVDNIDVETATTATPADTLAELRRWTRQTRPDVQWVKHNLSTCKHFEQVAATVRESDSALPIDLEVHYETGGKHYEVLMHVVHGPPIVYAMVRAVAEHCENAPPDRICIPAIISVNCPHSVRYFTVSTSPTGIKLTQVDIKWLFVDALLERAEKKPC